MRRTRAVGLVLIAVVAAGLAPATAVAQTDSGDCSFPVERTDATGTTITVTAEPDSVVTLNPSAAQTLWEIGAQNKVAGVTKYASNLEGAAAKTNISGSGQTINNEEVVGLQPDLVIAPNTISNETVETLRNAELTVYRFREAESVEDIKRKTRIIGQLVGECDGARETVDWMESRLSTVDAAIEDADRPAILYSFYGFTAGENTFIDTLIERAGGTNVAAEAGITGYQRVNDEVIVQQDPDWIIRNSDNAAVPDSAAYNTTTAVQNGQVLVVNVNHLNRPAPRVVYAVTAMAEAFHPEAYAAANATATPTASESSDGTAEVTTTPADGGEESGGTETTSSTETPSASGPGFGVVAALVALAGAVVLGRRR